MGKAYQHLVTTMLSKGKASTEDMRQFKEQVSKSIPRFQGLGQQDSHEFLMALLDTISTEISTHEPNNEPCVTSGILAEECWLE